MLIRDFLLLHHALILAIAGVVCGALAAVGWLLWRRLRRELHRVYQLVGQLKADESRYRSLIENSLEGILIRRGDRPIFVNRAFAEMFGFATPEEALWVHSTREFMFPEDVASAEAADWDLMRGIGPKQERVRRKRLDGRTVWLELTRQPVIWEGAPAIQSVMIDVTARYLAEQALQSSEGRFRQMIQGSNLGIHIHRSPETLYVNPAFARIYGYGDAAEFLVHGKSHLHVPEEERAATFEAEQALLRGDVQSMQVVARRTSRDGRSLILEIKRSRIDWEGAPAVMSEIADITERHDAEAALRAGENRFRTLIEEAPQAMHIRRDGRSLFVNRAFARIYGYDSSEDFLSQTEALTHVPLSQRADLMREDQAILSGELRHVETQALRRQKDGTPIWVEVHRRRVEWEGKTAVLATSVDITERYSTEAALRESEQRFRAMIETIPTPVAITHMSDGRFLFVNPQFEQLIGADADALLGRRGGDFYGEKRDIRMVDQAMREYGAIAPTEIQFRRIDGTLFWAVMAARLFTYKGESAVLVALSDVTERKAMEEAIRASEQRMRAIIETIPVPVAIITASDARFAFANPPLERALGTSAEILLHHGTFDAHLSAEDFDRVRRSLAEFNELVPQEFRLRRGDGNDFWAMVSARNFSYRGEEAILAVLNDVSERRAMEEALRESRERLRAVVNNSPLVLLAVDAAGRVTLLEGKPLTSIGLKPGLALGAEYEEVFHHIPQLVSDIRSAQLGRAFRSVVETQKVALEFWYQPVAAGSGEPGGAIGVGTDITELRAREQDLIQAQKMEAVGQLTGGVAHDFNNLLTIILGNTELLEMSVTVEQAAARHQVELIRNAALRGAELSQRLLAFSRRQPLQPKAVLLTRFLDDMAVLLTRTLGEHISIDISVPEGAWQPVADHSQLSNALINLAVNARDAMPDGGRLAISVQNLPWQEAFRSELALSPHDYVLLTVADSGTGMTDDVRKRAFDPFFTTKDVGKGSGLGLSMVYGFAKQSGGLVRIESAPGKGTGVFLYLPRAMRRDAAQAIQSLDLHRPTGTETILIVEDDHGVREFAVRLLRELGYRVTAAETAQEAIDLIDRMGPPDLLFSDVILPGAMSGEQLALQVKARCPTIKVLFTSGYTSDHLQMAGKHLEGVQLLDKPYKSQQLASVIRQVLDRHS